MEPHWKQNDRSGQVMENIRRFEGLWEKCTSSAVGINACDQFDHFIIGKFTVGNNRHFHKLIANHYLQVYLDCYWLVVSLLVSDSFSWALVLLSIFLAYHAFKQIKPIK